MAANYTELKTEIQNWLDRSDAGLIAAIPVMIEDAENVFNRRIRTWQMECSSKTPLVQNGVTEETRGVYPLPADWSGHKTVRRDGTDLHIIYYRKIPRLTDSAPTNWLLAAHADLYRHGALVSAESWLKNDPRIPLWTAARDQALVEIQLVSTREEHSDGPIRTLTPNDRIWRIIKRTDGSFDYKPSHDFFDIVSSGLTKEQLGLLNMGYFTVSHGAIHIWPKPGEDPSGDFGWSVCP